MGRFDWAAEFQATRQVSNFLPSGEPGEEINFGGNNGVRSIGSNIPNSPLLYDSGVYHAVFDWEPLTYEIERWKPNGTAERSICDAHHLLRYLLYRDALRLFSVAYDR